MLRHKLRKSRDYLYNLLDNKYGKGGCILFVSLLGVNLFLPILSPLTIGLFVGYVGLVAGLQISNKVNPVNSSN